MESTSILLSERKYDTAQEVEAITRILVPSLVRFVEDIIELCPELHIFDDPEFQSCAYIHGRWKIDLTSFGQRHRSIKSIECTVDIKILQHLQTHGRLPLQRKQTPGLDVLFRFILIETEI